MAKSKDNKGQATVEYILILALTALFLYKAVIGTAQTVFYGEGQGDEGAIVLSIKNMTMNFRNAEGWESVK